MLFIILSQRRAIGAAARDVLTPSSSALLRKVRSASPAASLRYGLSEVDGHWPADRLPRIRRRAAWRALRRHAHEGSHLQARSHTPGRWRPLRPECCFRLPHSTLFAFTNRTEIVLPFRASTVLALNGRDG